MTIVRSCTPEEYISSFWMRERQKHPNCQIPATEKEKKEVMSRKWPHKFPFDGNREFTWQICRIDTQQDLENLWIHKSGPFLEDHGLWTGSTKQGCTLSGKILFCENLGNLAKMAIETNFCGGDPNTGQYKNYLRWKDKHLAGQLDGDQKPMLVHHNEYIDILDGFGRLLPSLSVVCEVQLSYDNGVRPATSKCLLGVILR